MVFLIISCASEFLLSCA